MMDKSDTFFSTKIARLIEGLPGTELAPSYVFHTNRSSSGGNQWVHEAKLRHQKQQQKKQDMAGKPSNHVAAKSTKSKIEQEKVSVPFISEHVLFIMTNPQGPNLLTTPITRY